MPDNLSTYRCRSATVNPQVTILSDYNNVYNRALQHGDRPLTFHPFMGSPPELIDMPFGVLSGVPDVITHAKFYVNQLRGFFRGAPLKVPFSILIRMTLRPTTVLHYCADCEIVEFIDVTVLYE